MRNMLLVALLTAAVQGASDWEARLPRPVYDEKPELVAFYDKAWEIAHTRIDNLPGIPVPRYMDEGHRSDFAVRRGRDRHQGGERLHEHASLRP